MHMLMANKLAALATAISDDLGLISRGLSGSASAALLTLLYRQPMSTTALARVLGISQPTAVRVVDGLVGAGWVERATRTGRVVHLRLTRTGLREGKALQHARLARVTELLAALDHEDKVALDRLLSRLLTEATDGRPTARRICRFCDHTLCHGADCPVGSQAARTEAQSEVKR